MDFASAKSDHVKNESKRVLFRAPGDAQKSANGTMINVFEVT